MDAEQQRKLAVRLAKEAGAEKTLAAIKDTEACYNTIFNTAIEELGIETMTGIILEGDPSWAHEVLNYFPELGNASEALKKKAAEDEKFASFTYPFETQIAEPASAGRGVESGPEIIGVPITGFDMLQRGVYLAYLRVKWINNGTTYITENEYGPYAKDTNPRIHLDVYAHKHNLPLADGDIAWPLVEVVAGQTVELNSRYVYKRQHGYSFGVTVCRGTTQNVEFVRGGIQHEQYTNL